MSGIYTKKDDNDEYDIIVEVDEDSHHTEVSRSNIRVKRFM